MFHNRRKVEPEHLLLATRDPESVRMLRPVVVIGNYCGTVQPIYNTVYRRMRIDWIEYGLSAGELRARGLTRYTYGDPQWHQVVESPMFLADELVLTAFVGPAPPLHYAEHIDGDQGNCCLDNLRWTFSAEWEESIRLRRRSIEERESALLNPRQGHCRAS
ncbi:hypothetical protein A5781_06105 [Mycobacterium sp. 852002-30065_SCH5024008]|nr:hypothetical protein A5781_06105 [Mycobacterium sp. 852002-30065_SCH5024008]